LKGYKRVDAHAYDAFGLDVSCNYDHGDAVITFYLTRRASGTLAAEMDAAKSEFLRARAKVHPALLSESQVSMGERTWDMALYADDGGLRDAIWFTDLDGWTFEYRATYRTDAEARVADDLTVITTQVIATAGADLARCADTPMTIGTGELVSEQGPTTATALLNGLFLDATSSDSPVAEADEAMKPLTWCVERSLTEGDLPMLLWRAVFADGRDASADMVSLMTVGAPPRLIAEAHPWPSTMTKPNGTPSLWVAHLQVEGVQGDIFGLFEGRPAPDKLSALAFAIFTNKGRPLGAYFGDGGTPK
jgi:hypothetical protein